MIKALVSKKATLMFLYSCNVLIFLIYASKKADFFTKTCVYVHVVNYFSELFGIILACAILHTPR